MQRTTEGTVSSSNNGPDFNSTNALTIKQDKITGQSWDSEAGIIAKSPAS